MLDFLMISTRSGKRGIIEIYPKFIIKKSNDLMIRGGDFYAIWIDERGIWSTDEQDAVDLIDRELDQYAEENRKRFDGNIRVLHMWDAETGMIDTWHKYCQKQMKDQFHMSPDCHWEMETRNSNLAESLDHVTRILKDAKVNYLTRPMQDGEEPETHTFQQSSEFGVFEGTVTIPLAPATPTARTGPFSAGETSAPSLPPSTTGSRWTRRRLGFSMSAWMTTAGLQR